MEPVLKFAFNFNLRHYNTVMLGWTEKSLLFIKVGRCRMTPA
jgi:hypothetical protein